MAKVAHRAAARRDLIEHYVYLTENGSVDIAERFISNAEGSFNDLAEHPNIGAPLALRDPRLTGIRKWRVTGFDNFLIFYFPLAEGVSIVRVLHSAQDWWGALGFVDPR